MHISYTGVQDASAYAPADERGLEQASPWAYLAVVVPLTLLYAIAALVAAMATAASALGVSWLPVG